MVTTTRSFVVLTVALLVLAYAWGYEVDELAHGAWDGVHLFHAVNKTVIQAILNEYHQQSSNGRNPPQLFIPSNPLPPGELQDYEHVAYLDFGVENFLEFEGTKIEGQHCATVSIPLLAAEPGDPPAYSLAIREVCHRSGIKPFPRVDLAVPYIEIDQVQINEDGAILRNGTEEMLVSFRRYTNPCEEPSFAVRAEFNEFIDYDVQMGALAPNFDVCDDQTIRNRFCYNVTSIRRDHGDIGPNFCQSSWHSDDRQSCKAALIIDKVTPEFRNFLLLGVKHVKPIATETNTGHFAVSIKFPCIESQ